MDIKKNHPLAPVSTFGIGGTARYFVEVFNSDEMVEAAKYFNKQNIPIQIIAGGSNSVFADGVIDRAFIKISSSEKPSVSKDVLIADSGIDLMEVVNVANKHGLSGMEKLAGIPGTIGGAVIGNAGAYGHSVEQILDKVLVFDGEKEIELGREDCGFAYRESIFKKPKAKGWILKKIYLKLKSENNPNELKKVSSEIVSIREKKYPPELRCPGSFFKNVLVKNISEESLQKINQEKIIDGKIPAGYLLEEVGAKGMKYGGLEIADYHGNLLINRGGATFKDVKELSSILKIKTKDRFGIEIEEEVRYVE